MAVTSLTIIGAGNLNVSPQVLAALANYFGERHLSVCLFDLDKDGLVVAFRLAQALTAITKATHSFTFQDDYEAALERADGIVFIPDDRLIRRLAGVGPNQVFEVKKLWRETRLKWPGISTIAFNKDIIEPDSTCSILNEWPVKPVSAQSFSWPLQLLRWSNGEEYPLDLIRENREAPLLRWLNNPSLSEL